MKTLFLCLLLSSIAYAGNKAAPRASPVDPWIEFFKAERLSIKQICDRGYIFTGPVIRNRADSKGTLTHWVFQDTAANLLPLFIEVPEYPSGHEFNIATVAAQGEVNELYQIMKNQDKDTNLATPSPSPPKLYY